MAPARRHAEFLAFNAGRFVEQALLAVATLLPIVNPVGGAPVFLALAERLTRAIGPTGTQVLLRFSAFILLRIGVQIVWSGVAALLATVPSVRG